MTSKSQIGVLVAVTVAQWCSASLTAQQLDNPKNLVLAAARVENSSKTVDGKSYQLVAFKMAGSYFLASNATSGVCLVNGRRLQFPVGPDELPLDVPTGFPMGTESGIVGYWVQMPANGTVEILCGLLNTANEEDARRRFTTRGMNPIVIDVAKIPVIRIEGGRVKDIEAAFAKFETAVQKGPPKESVANTQPATQTQPARDPPK